MTTMENALRKALGQPENNRITGDWKEKQDQEKRDAAHRLRMEELDDDETRYGLGEFERENEYGYKDLGFYDKGHWFPICTACGCHKMANRGEGTVCDHCNYQATHDHY